MKQKIICTAFVIFSFCIIKSYSQDYIHTLESEIIKAKVLEVKPNIVTYKKFSNIDGPTYEIPSTTIYKIVYKNGEEDIINKLSQDGITGINFTFFIKDTLFITQIEANSPAQNANIAVGDKIVRINKEKVGNFKTMDYVNYLLNGAPESNVEIEVIRGVSGKSEVFTVQRKRKEEFLSKTNPENSNLDESKSTVEDVTPTTNSSNNNQITSLKADVKNGFFGSFTFGLGGYSFEALEPFALHFEFEIGRVIPKSNVLQSFKFMIINFPDDEIDLFSLKYSAAGYFGKYTKQGFFIGGDLGMSFYPRGDLPLWDLGLIMGYSFRLHKNIRLEIPGSLNLLPTVNFSNVAVGGYVGIRLSGIM